MAVSHSPLALFILQAAFIIVSARGLGLLARRFGQPMVIAEIAAGIMLGPSLLGWFAPGLEKSLFPKASLPLIGTMSQVGVLLFMFLVGIELDPNLLRGRARSSIAISQASIVLPFGLGALLALYLYPRVSSPDVRLAAFIVFIGLAMSITAFPVLARILLERRLLHTHVGAVTLACAAVDDVTAWCLLALVVALVRSANLLGAAQTALFAAGYIAFMVLVIRPALRRITDRSRLGMTQNLVAVTLLLMLASAWVTELLGIHALFGAFIFGAILPKEGGFVQHLAEKIEDLVVVFLLPLFFAYSGLRTQVGLLDSGHAWVMCGVIIAVACAGKFGGSAIAARLTGMTWRESSALGIMMNTRGLVELIALNIGLDLGVISPTLFTMMVIMALVTTFMTTPLLQWVYPTDLVEEPLAESDKPASETRFTVLLCVAFERSGPALLTVGAALTGKNPKRPGQLYALRLIRPTEGASFVLGQQRAPAEEAALLPLFERARELDVQVRPLAFVSPEPARDICDVAEVKRADIVLLGWHKPLIGMTMLSGTVHDVMERAPADVGVLVDRGLREIRSVLVPYLGSDHDRGALRLARRLAENAGARVTILHVTQPARGGDLGVQEKIHEIFEEPGPDGAAIAVAMKVVEAPIPSEAVLAEAGNGYDLIVVGVGPQWGLLHKSFGMQSEAILKRSPVSVLVLRAEQAPVSAAVRRESLSRTPASGPQPT